MRIAIYYPWIYLKSGAERTILETVKRSKHEYTIFTNHYDKESTYPEFKNLDVVQLTKIPVKRDLFSVLKAALIISLQKIDFSDYDLLLVHSDGLGDLLLFRKLLPFTFYPISVVCYCHSPLRPVYDKFYKKRALKKRSMVGKFFYLLFSAVFNALDEQLWRNYKFVIFSSRETLRRAKEGGLLKGMSSNKYEINHPGINYKRYKQSNKYKKYFIVPGRIMWAKNIELAIRSFRLFKEKGKDNKFKLIIAGIVDKKSKAYLEKLKQMAGNRSDVHFHNFGNITALIQNSYACLFPSFNEDWGILPLECNAMGKPVIAVNRGGFRESQFNGKTGYLVKANPKDFSKAMIKLALDKKLCIKMGRFARKSVQKYDWDKFIKKFDARLDYCAK